MVRIFCVQLIALVILGYSDMLYGNEGLKSELELSALMKLVDVKDLSTIETLEKSAKEKSNHLYLAHAYHSKCVHYTMYYEEDSISHYADKVSHELSIIDGSPNSIHKEEEIELYQQLKIKLANHIVHKYLSDNLYNLALIYIDQILKESNLGEYSILEYEAYYLSGVCYLHLKKGVEALSSFKKAYGIYKANSKINHNPFSYHRPLRGMSHTYLILKDYDNVIAINDSIETMLDKDFQDHKDQSFFYFQSKYVISNEIALALIMKGDLQNARKRLDRSDKIFIEHLKDSPLKHAYYEVEAQYYSAIGEHEKAKEYINTSLNSYHANIIYKNINNYITGNLIKADILSTAGDGQEAYKLLRDLYRLNDSVNSTSFSNQLAEIQTLYKVDKMEVEAERDKIKLRATQSTLVISLLISLLLAYLAYVIFKNSKRLKDKNKQLYKRFTELEDKEYRIKELESSFNNTLKEDIAETDSYSNLINKLNAYLSDNKVYTNPDITREELALAVGTNRQYLIEAIKEKTGKTFNEYIYSFRIKYAYELMTKNKLAKISDICNESGFVTRGTFNRVFKDTYGMNPSELRDILD